jgi:hypothetical protein
MATASAAHDGLLCRLLAVGDWGSKREGPVQELAAAMATFAQQHWRGKPDMILGLGDNFYPDGVRSVDDARFQTTWVQPFLSHPELHVPWHMVLGNHDYKWSSQAQVDFTLSPHNPRGMWNMPARTYQFSQSHVAFFGTFPLGRMSDIAIKCSLTRLFNVSHFPPISDMVPPPSPLWVVFSGVSQPWTHVGLSTQCVSTTRPSKRH